MIQAPEQSFQSFQYYQREESGSVMLLFSRSCGCSGLLSNVNLCKGNVSRTAAKDNMYSELHNFQNHKEYTRKLQCFTLSIHTVLFNTHLLFCIKAASHQSLQPVCLSPPVGFSANQCLCSRCCWTIVQPDINNNKPFAWVFSPFRHGWAIIIIQKHYVWHEELQPVNILAAFLSCQIQRR